jgi:MoxR-like ATPase
MSDHLPFGSVAELQAALGEHAYLADRGLSTAIYLSLSLGKPLLLEGEAGVGKTEVAKVLSELLGRTLIRLQCYEGIDANQALYEWNYSRQLIAVRAMDAQVAETHVEDLFGPEFLVERPLLAAIRAGDRAVLLVDELDRADDEFEAFLLEVLSTNAVTVPELGTITAANPPLVVLTSNRTREVHDALKRRCLYHWIDYPTANKEFEIVSTRVPDVPARLAHEVVAFVHRLRTADLTKVPGVAETLDWAGALLSLGATELDPDLVDETLGVVLKYEEDIRQVRGAAARQYLAEAGASGV